MKKALFAVLAAFSLSACDFDIQKLPGQVADTVGGWIDSVKDFITGGGDKKEEQEEQPCEHQDADHDGVCDLCGEQGLVVTHTDANHDHLCDVCGAEVSQCKDENNDHLCDECGATLSTCKDENNDFKCDICGKDLAAVSFELDTSAAIKEFAKGAQFSSAGVKVVVTSEVGSTQEITELTFSEPDMTTVGEKTISVSYSFAGVEHSDEYKINVSYWSENDLKVLAAGVSLTRYAETLPYLPGYNMRVETVLDEEGYITDWSIVADNVDDEALLDYVNMLEDYSASVTLSQKEVTFDIKSFAASGLEGLYDLSDVNAFSLIPYYVGNYGNERFFVNDEYIVVGRNSEGQLVLKNKFVNAMLDGMFFGDELADGNYYFPAQYNSYLNYLPEILGYYYSELSPSAFLLPTLAEDVYVVPINLVSIYPFEEALDQYDLAWYIELGYAKEQTYLDYCAALEEYGFTKETLESGRVSYYIENDLLGYLEIMPGYDAEAELADGSTGEEVYFNFYYIAPDSYTNHLDVVVLDMAKKLGVSIVELDNEDYEDYGRVIANGSFKDETITDGKVAAEKIARGFLAEGYSILHGFDYDEDYDQYFFSAANEETYMTVYVDAKASEEGSFGVEFYVFDAEEGENVLSKAEKETFDMIKRMLEFDPLKGVDYTDNGDGSYSWSLPWGADTLEVIQSVADLQQFSEFISYYIWPTYEQASSAQSEAGNSWVTVYDDKTNGLECIAETFVDETEGAYTVITYLPKIFVSPESEMVRFLTEVKGAAPAEGDYTLNEDGSCVATFAVEGEHTAEELQALAEGYVATFGEKYTVISSAAGEAEGSWLVVLDDAESNIEVTITAALSEGGVSFTVTTGAIPVKYMTPLEALTVVGTPFSKTPALQEDGSYYIGGAFYASSYSVDAIKSYLEQFTPKEFVKIQDWTAGTFDDGTAYQMCVFMNEDNTVLQYYVFSDDYGTEESPVDVTVFQAYSYTYSA